MPAPLRSRAEALVLLDAERQMLEHGAEVLAQVAEIEAADRALEAEALATGRSAWRQCADDEDDKREAGQAWRVYGNPDVWAAYD